VFRGEKTSKAASILVEIRGSRERNAEFATTRRRHRHCLAAGDVVEDDASLPPCRELKAPVLPAMIRSSSGLNKTLEESGIFPVLLYRRLRDTGSF